MTTLADASASGYVGKLSFDSLPLVTRVRLLASHHPHSSTAPAWFQERWSAAFDRSTDEMSADSSTREAARGGILALSKPSRAVVINRAVVTAVAIGAAVAMVAVYRKDMSHSSVQKTRIVQTMIAYDGALADGAYKSACGMIEPLIGLPTLERFLGRSGKSSNCAADVRTLAKMLGKSRLRRLRAARVTEVDYSMSANGTGAAQAIFDRETVTWGKIPVVGLVLERGKWMLQCPPFVCGATLQAYVSPVHS